MSFSGSSASRKQHLGDDQVRHLVVNRSPEKNDVVPQQPGINVIRTLAPAGLFDHHGHKHRFAPLSSVRPLATVAYRRRRRVQGSPLRVTRGGVESRSDKRLAGSPPLPARRAPINNTSDSMPSGAPCGSAAPVPELPVFCYSRENRITPPCCTAFLRSCRS